MTDTTIAELQMEIARLQSQLARLVLGDPTKVVGGSTLPAPPAAVDKITRLTAELTEARKLANINGAMWSEAEADVVALTEPLKYGDMLCFTRGTFNRMVEEKTGLEQSLAQARAAMKAAAEALELTLAEFQIWLSSKLERKITEALALIRAEAAAGQGRIVSIDDFERILNSDPERMMHIKPDGTVVDK